MRNKQKKTPKQVTSLNLNAVKSDYDNRSDINPNNIFSVLNEGSGNISARSKSSYNQQRQEKSSRKARDYKNNYLKDFLSREKKANMKINSMI